MVVYDAKGNPLLEAGRKYHELGDDGYREIDPLEVLTKVKEVLKEIGLAVGPELKGMAITSLGNPLYVSIRPVTFSATQW